VTDVVELESVRRRLEAFLHALYDRRWPLAATDPPAPLSWWRRYVLRRKARVHASAARSATDGARIWLPRAVAAHGNVDGASVYRVLAMIQAEFATRGSPLQLRHLQSALERDLFAIYEAAAAEYAIATTHPGLTHAVGVLRSSARPRLHVWLARSNTAIADLRDEVLSTAPTIWPRSLPPRLDATGARSWARGVAAAFNPRLYWPIGRVWQWGTLLDPTRTAQRDDLADLQAGMIYLPVGNAPQQSAASQGETLAQSDDAGAAGEASSSGTVAVGDPSQAGTAIEAWNQPSAEIPGLGASASLAARYHEWDSNVAEFEPDRVSVFESSVEPGDPEWATRTAYAYRGLIRRVEREFQTLGAHRVRLTRQPDGDDLDLQACIDLRVAVRSRHTPDEKVYAVTRPPRGGVALAILADVSGSAEATLAPGVRVIDIEKVALLVATHALETTGDRHAIFAFSSMGAPRVAVRTAKSFDERGAAAVGQRIAALDSLGNTRLGAAIRHATAVLRRERAARHLLLVISDGLPNDTDGYVEDYGIEDARMAVLEARARGVMPHCLTLSAEDHYALRIFGSAAQVVVRKPEHLPAAMLDVLGRLLRR
jgi:nitric oxide reductase NorD protein